MPMDALVFVVGLMIVFTYKHRLTTTVVIGMAALSGQVMSSSLSCYLEYLEGQKWCRMAWLMQRCPMVTLCLCVIYCDQVLYNGLSADIAFANQLHNMTNVPFSLSQYGFKP